LNEVRLVVSDTDELVVDVMRDAEGKRLIVSNTAELVVERVRDSSYQIQMTRSFVIDGGKHMAESVRSLNQKVVFLHHPSGLSLVACI
jgi:hypothetical protein